MGWSPDVIAGVTIAIILALIGWGGTAYCWWHKKRVAQGEVSTVDTWLSKKGTTGAGLAGAHAGYAAPIEMQRPGQRQRDADLEREAGIAGVDTTGELVQPPPPVYSEREHQHQRQEHAGSAGQPGEVPGYHEHR